MGTDANFDTHNIKACTDSACSVGCTAGLSQYLPASAVLFGDSNSYYACVQAKDLAGNTSAYVASASPVVIDATAPVAGNAARIEYDDLSYYSVNLSWTGLLIMYPLLQICYSVYYLKTQPLTQ